jgi:hypothetical protein
MLLHDDHTFRIHTDVSIPPEGMVIHGTSRGDLAQGPRGEMRSKAERGFTWL